MATLLKLILFIDAQNVYHRARETFALGTDSHIDGQIDPWAVAELIAARGGPRQEPVEVMGVRIYTGYHTPERDSRAYASYRKQRASWEQSGCHVVARAVRYSGPDDRHGREKGIDVALAVDYVRLAIQHEFEIGVIFSVDTDLAPALEFVKSLNDPSLMPATAAWYGEGAVTQINVPGVWCHRLSKADYIAVHDPTDYAPLESVEGMTVRLRDSLRRRPD